MQKNEPINAARLQQIFLAIIVLVMVGAVLKATSTVVLPLIMAWLLAYLVGPVVNWLNRRHIPNLISIIIVLLVLLGLIYLVGMFILQRLTIFVAAYPKYQAQWIYIVREVLDTYDFGREGLTLIDLSKHIQQYLLSFSNMVVKFLSNLVLVIIFLFFMLLGKKYSIYKIGHMFSATRGKQTLHILTKTSSDIRRYLALQFIISAVTGICVGAGLKIIGVDFAVTWGALAFILNFIPNIGSIVASIPPILIALVQFYPSPWPALATALTLLAIQQTIGNFIAPKVLGDSLDLSPVAILISLLFFGWMWGIVGAIISVPIAVAIKIACDNISGLEFLGVLMSSGRKYRTEFLAKECGGKDNDADYCK